MEILGQIVKKNDDLSYGFVSTKGYEDIFFSPDTEYSGTTFGTLKVGDKVKTQIKETDRGLFAVSLSLVVSKIKLPEPEASL